MKNSTKQALVIVLVLLLITLADNLFAQTFQSNYWSVGKGDLIKRNQTILIEKSTIEIGDEIYDIVSEDNIEGINNRHFKCTDTNGNEFLMILWVSKSSMEFTISKDSKRLETFVISYKK
jgi:hypothetical protein